MINIVIDAGTTWSKIIERKKSNYMKGYEKYIKREENDCRYYIIPSVEIKGSGIIFDKGTGHMTKNMLKRRRDYENEIIALIKGYRKRIKEDGIILDMGSRDAKWAKYKEGKFKDLDWNSSCSSSTGATIEMLLKFYNVEARELKYTKEKYIITCGIFGLERIMDDIAKGSEAKEAISRFIHGIAYNAWTFAKKPQKIYLSGGFCENKCFIDSLKEYCEVEELGRYILCEGLMEEKE